MTPSPTAAPISLPDWTAFIVAIAPIAALLLSGAALWVSISSRRVSGKAFKLAEAKEDRQAPMLDLEVVTTTSATNATRDRVIDVDIRVTNRSEVASSIRSASLWVSYTKNGHDNRVEVSPDLSAATAPAFPLPCKLDARDARQGWLRFHLNSARIKGWSITAFDLVLLDTDSRTVTYKGLSVKEVL